MGVPGTLPRIVPKQAQPFVVEGKVIPPGVRSSTIVFLRLHTDTSRHWLVCRRIP